MNYFTSIYQVSFLFQIWVFGNPRGGTPLIKDEELSQYDKMKL